MVSIQSCWCYQVVFNSMPSWSKVPDLCSWTLLFMKVTTGDITSSFLKWNWNCETGIRESTIPEYMSSSAFMPWDDNESDELGETAPIIIAAKSATLAMGEFLAEGLLEVKVLDGCEVTAETDPCGGSGDCEVWTVPAAEELAEACQTVPESSKVVPDTTIQIPAPTVAPRIVIPSFIHHMNSPESPNFHHTQHSQSSLRHSLPS